MQFNKEIRMEKMNVKPATGKLGVLCVGLGAVTSTFMTGVLMARGLGDVYKRQGSADGS